MTQKQELSALEKSIQEKEKKHQEKIKQLNEAHKKEVAKLKEQAADLKKEIKQVKSILPVQFKFKPLGTIDPSECNFSNVKEFFKEMRQQAKNKGLKVRTFGPFEYCLNKVDFNTGLTDSFELYSALTKDIIGQNQSKTTQNIFDNLKNNSASQITGKNIAHVIMQQGLKLKDGERFSIYMATIKASHDVSRVFVFSVCRYGDVLVELGLHCANSGHVWYDDTRLFFSTRN